MNYIWMTIFLFGILVGIIGRGYYFINKWRLRRWLRWSCFPANRFESITPLFKIYLATSQGYYCPICCSMLSTDWSCDHIVPTSIGGSDKWYNLQILHPGCHQHKTSFFDQLLWRKKKE